MEGTTFGVEGETSPGVRLEREITTVLDIQKTRGVRRIPVTIAGVVLEIGEHSTRMIRIRTAMTIKTPATTETAVISTTMPSMAAITGMPPTTTETAAISAVMEATTAGIIMRTTTGGKTAITTTEKLLTIIAIVLVAVTTVGRIRAITAEKIPITGRIPAATTTGRIPVTVRADEPDS